MINKYISHGPFLGHLTWDSVKFWFRSARGQKETFILRLFKDGELLDFKECEVLAINDFIAVAEFTGLRDGAEYELKVFLALDCIQTQSFKTKTKSKKNLHFVFGSCRYNHWHNFIQNDAEEGDETFAEILKVHNKKNLDFLLFLGDQIYSDPTYSIGVSETFEDYSETYQESFALANFQQLLSEVPAYMILDDHEIRDNWSRDMLDEFAFFENREEMYRNGIKTYELWQHSRNPNTKKKQYWYHFEQNGHPFFILDIRTLRRNKSSASHAKTLLGHEQLESLFLWLLDNKNKAVRIIGSGVPFCPDYVKNEDKWCAFDEERNLILEFIRLEGIGKTIFLSGDVHLGVFSKMTCVQDDKVEVFNFVSSPLHWPYRGMYISDFHGEKTLTYEQWDSKKKKNKSTFEFKYETSDWLRENQFAEMQINEDGTGFVRHFNMKDKSFDEKYYF